MGEIPGWVPILVSRLPRVEAEAVGSSDLEIRYGRHRLRLEVKYVPRVGAREREWLLSVPPGRTLVVTRRLSDQAREELARARLSWVEHDTGVVHLDAPSILVHWTFPRPAGEEQEPSGKRAPSLKGIGSTIGELLLCDYRHRQFTLAEVANRAQASKQRTGQVLTSLVEAGWIEATGRTRTRTYSVRDVAALLDHWADQLRAPESRVYAYRWTRSTETLFVRLTYLDEMQIRWAVGGAAASYLHHPALSEVPLPTVWVDTESHAYEAINVLEADPAEAAEDANLIFWFLEGNPALRFTTRMSPHWMGELSLPVVSVPRAYAEARWAGGRASDAAEVLREEILS
jgi:hypothetical protein